VLERQAIFRALRERGGDKEAAAKLLGIGRTTMYRKLREYKERALQFEAHSFRSADAGAAQVSALPTHPVPKENEAC